MNEVIKNILTRRSCKKYSPDPVPQELIDQVVEAGLYAPNGMRLQSPIILAVSDKELRDALSALNAKYDPMKRPDPYYGAPVVLSVLVKTDCPTAVEDGSLVMENMMLAAHSLGLGSCWIHRAKPVFEDPEGKEILAKLGVEGEYRGIANMALGYWGCEVPEAAPRREGRVYRA